MAKRLIDTELWNNEDIIENFTAEDKYFWLYLLTSPHNNVCGVFKNSPALMARDMGLHKDTIVNLIYRFESIHKLLYCDKETNEILILNWYKFNWTKSADFMKTIEKQLNSIQSKTIVNMLLERINEKQDKTVIRPSNDGTNTITNNTNNNIIDLNTLNEWFTIIYRIYPRKVGKVQARTTFEHKFVGIEIDEAKQKVKAIKKMLETQCEIWRQEQRDEKYIPYFSTWLNDNIEDSPNRRGKK